MPDPLQPSYLKSGFAALDDLLGGRGFIMGSTILFQGKPGTGKTTFAVQIAQHAFTREDHSVVFLCVEDEPEIVLNQVTQSHWNEPFSTYLHVGAKVKVIGPSELTSRWSHLTGTSTAATVHTFLRDLWMEITPRKGSGILFIVDSLNALLYRAQLFFPEYDDRSCLRLLLRSFESWVGDEYPRPTVIFTAEDTSLPFSEAAASYSVDVLVHLERRHPEYERPITTTKTVKWREDLHFCEIHKGRGLPVQRRSCCYEFVTSETNKGIQFFPTYAAQGMVSLFFENRPQAAVIEDLRFTDLPSAYPGVHVQEFSQSALERTFALTRYQNNIPPRHPMLLSHVDEYWIGDMRKRNLLKPIPRSRLRLYSLPFESAASPEPILVELADKKFEYYLDGTSKSYMAVPQMGNVGMLVWRKDVLEKIGLTTAPSTWEKLEKACLDLQEREGFRFPFLLETRTYDTLMVTILELGWSHGAFWRTKPADSSVEHESEELLIVDSEDKVIDSKSEAFARLVLAFERLKRWIHDLQIVAPDSTLDPDVVDPSSWAFARHWYSTWIDVLTRHQENIRYPADGIYGISQIPLSEAHMDDQIDMGYDPVRHYSCSGEWYLALQSHTENVELGVDLINNLMSSRKVTERAFSGAEIPILEAFYDNYGSAMCTGTDRTYNEVRHMFARHARSRTEFYDYRKVARILSGAIKAVVTNRNADVPTILEIAFDRIRSSRTRP